MPYSLWSFHTANAHITEAHFLWVYGFGPRGELSIYKLHSSCSLWEQLPYSKLWYRCYKNDKHLSGLAPILYLWFQNKSSSKVIISLGNFCSTWNSCFHKHAFRWFFLSSVARRLKACGREGSLCNESFEFRPSLASGGLTTRRKKYACDHLYLRKLFEAKFFVFCQDKCPLM